MSDTSNLQLAVSHLRIASTKLEPKSQEQSDVVAMIHRLEEILRQAAPKPNVDVLANFEAFLKTRIAEEK